MRHGMFSARDVEKLLRKSDLDALVRQAEGDCDHQEVDKHFACLDCGADRAEEILSREYDRQKDLRKYGE